LFAQDNANDGSKQEEKNMNEMQSANNYWDTVMLD
jgi:hypothetical protein